MIICKLFDNFIKAIILIFFSKNAIVVPMESGNEQFKVKKTGDLLTKNKVKLKLSSGASGIVTKKIGEVTKLKVVDENPKTESVEKGESVLIEKK